MRVRTRAYCVLVYECMSVCIVCTHTSSPVTGRAGAVHSTSQNCERGVLLDVSFGRIEDIQGFAGRDVDRLWANLASKELCRQTEGKGKGARSWTRDKRQRKGKREREDGKSDVEEATIECAASHRVHPLCLVCVCVILEL